MTYKLFNENCLDILKTIPDCSVDSIITDPPFGLKFMGRKWDYNIPGQEYWEEIIRTAKPGSHLLAFGGTRTFHRLVCAVEDAGWDIRDTIVWVCGSSMPKNVNIGKAIDKELGVSCQQTIEGEKYQGCGTCLKPSCELIVLARKPLIGTVAKNVLEYGTGALNIDDCRVGIGDFVSGGGNNFDAWRSGEDRKDRPDIHGKPSEGHNKGRFPANLIHDGSDEVVDLFPITKHGDKRGNCSGKRPSGFGNVGHDKGDSEPNSTVYNDIGSAARFFYCAKASKKERGEGNNHPTVKPQALMKYLCKLITPLGGMVLDPFMGSGSTAVAALELEFNFLGIEIEENYFNIAKNRISEILI